MNDNQIERRTSYALRALRALLEKGQAIPGTAKQQGHAALPKKSDVTPDTFQAVIFTPDSNQKLCKTLVM